VNRAELGTKIAALIERLADGARDDAARDALLRDALQLQRDTVPAYGRMLERFGAAQADPLFWPALPTDVFRFARVAPHPESEDVAVFRTSGTTGGPRGAHHLRDLSLYDQAARVAARCALFPDAPRMQLVLLAPAAAEQPDSSLGYMLERFGEWFGRGMSTRVIARGELDVESLVRTLRSAEQQSVPVALLGTTFAFVHAEDALGSRRFALPAGSRIMQTGGLKGRARSVEQSEMLRLLGERYGIDERKIVQEYGMTELCSQLYEHTLRQAVLGLPASGRRLVCPGWVRATPVDPETLEPVSAGSEGILRIDDLANLDSVCAIQTSDRARLVDGGLELLGRAEGATPRGCSLALDHALGGGA